MKHKYGKIKKNDLKTKYYFWFVFIYYLVKLFNLKKNIPSGSWKYSPKTLFLLIFIESNRKLYKMNEFDSKLEG